MKTPEEAPRGALAEGAQRLERLARIVKDSQLARTKAGPQPPASEAFTLAPDEAWAKKYMTQCIGPVCFVPPVAGGPKLEMRAAPPELSHGYADAQKQAETRPAGHQAAMIGQAIGKPPRPRSWLGRLIGR